MPVAFTDTDLEQMLSALNTRVNDGDIGSLLEAIGNDDIIRRRIELTKQLRASLPKDVISDLEDFRSAALQAEEKGKLSDFLDSRGLSTAIPSAPVALLAHFLLNHRNSRRDYEKWSEFSKKLTDKKYEGIGNSTILNLLSLVLSPTKECKRKITLKLEKQDIIDAWDDAISALEDSIDYFRTSYAIPVSQLLPYDALLVPFGYFFYQKKDKPDGMQRRYLEEFFWRACLSFRYSSSTESNLAQDIKRFDTILAGERPKYDDIKLQLNSPDDLINMEFRPETAIAKLLCVYWPRTSQRIFRITARSSSTILG